MNKRLLALSLIVTFAMISCATVFSPYRFVFINDSSHTVTVDADYYAMGGREKNRFTLKPGEKHSFSADSPGDFSYGPENKVTYETNQEDWYDHYWEIGRSLQRYWFYDR